MKITVATTTINVPVLLESYVSAAKTFIQKSNNEVSFVVAGDRKTPQEAKILCEKLSNSSGVEVEYLTPENQLELFQSKSAFTSILKWDCIQRRNFAGLRALEKKADIVIYIDDDNFITDTNYFDEHHDSFVKSPVRSQKSSNGFLNIMRHATGDGISNRIYPRGFPFNLRDTSPEIIEENKSSKIAANAGLWIEEADIDAVTRIASRPDIKNYDLQENISLNISTWSPLNSQNTAFLSKFLCGYFLSSEVGRYDDIYASYVFQKLINHFDYTSSYGKPIVTQHRNEHDLLVDLNSELSGMRNVDTIIDFIRNLPADGVTPMEYMKNLLDNWEFAMLKIEKNHPAVTDLRNLLIGYKIWIDVLRQIR